MSIFSSSVLATALSYLILPIRDITIAIAVVLTAHSSQLTIVTITTWAVLLR
jgi:hypothetical protein